MSLNSSQIRDAAGAFDTLGASVRRTTQFMERFDQVGNSLRGITTQAQVASTSFSTLASAAKGVGGPIGSLMGQAQSLVGLLGGGLPAAIMAVVAAIVAMGVSVAAVVSKLAMFAIASSDAAKNQRIMLEGMIRTQAIFRSQMAAMYGLGTNAAKELKTAEEAAGKLQKSIISVAGGVAIGEAEVGKYAQQLYTARLRGGDLTKALKTMSEIGSVAGDAEAQRFLALVQNARMYGGSIDGIIARYKGISGLAARQMLQFSVITDKLKTNVARLFSTVGTEKFATGLTKILSVFNDTTSSGNALHKIIETTFNGLLDLVASVADPVHNLFRGMVVGALLVAIAVLKVKKVFESTFGDTGLLSGIDTTWAMVYAGAAVAIGLAAALGVLGVALGVLTVLFLAAAAATFLFLLPFLLIGSVIVVAVIGAIATVSMLAIAFKTAYDFIAGLDFGAIASNMIQGLVSGITSGAGAVMAAVQSLASSMTSALQSALQIQSPSKVFAKLGVYTSVGMAEGIEQGAPQVESAVGSMVSVPAPQDTQGASVSRGGSTITINITGVEGAEQLKSSSFFEQLAITLEQALLSGGAA